LKSYSFEPSDIIIFPVIDWYYRFQRPQQIATRLAEHGHRVLYLRTYFLKGTEPVYQPLRDDLPIIDVQLGLPVPKDNNADQLDDDSKNILLDQFEFLQKHFNISKAICFVDLPFWALLVLELKKRHGWKIIYNSMDQLSGFSNVTPQMLAPEVELTQKSDLVLVTSHILLKEKAQLNSNCLLVPNGTDFDHFNYLPRILPNELIGIKKPIIGYYGAMSDWLDTELLYHLASARPNWNFVLIGGIESADISWLEKSNNIFLLGEKPYELLPCYLRHFDTCIIPFKKTLLTEATNPVKLFEFLSAGKSVVATDLHELRYYQEYVGLVSTVDEWLGAIELALKDYAPVQVTKRMRFARQNTWDERMILIQDAIQIISQDQGNSLIPLPLILPKENLISARLMTQHNGIDYWCLVYEKGDVVYKQTSMDLAEREARFLSRFESDYFLKPIELWVESGYSVIAFKKIQGQNLRDAWPSMSWSIQEFYRFIQHCLNMLLELKEKGVTHRNICRDNILVQGNKPILLDFGWAVSEQEPYFSPSGLGGYEHAPEDSFSDVFSIGRILEYVNRQHYRAFDQVISLMTNKDPTLRITEIDVLNTLFHTALNVTVEAYADQVNHA
jgi:glycosyltransferase involved in cell wall biosynthesis/tRNA A-37 threonylcarbamoyl transferase component Bud32